jgi:hypothetical protein
LNLTAWEKLIVGSAERLEEWRIDEGGETQLQGRDFSIVNRSCRDEDLATFCEDISCPIENQFSRSCRSNAVSSATHKNGKSNVVFERTNLLAHCGLRTVDPLRSPGKVLAFIDGDKVFEMAKLYRIRHSPDTPLA